MTLYKVYLFGEIQVYQGKNPIQLRDRTTKAMFAFILTRPNRSVEREVLKNEFWGGLSEKKASERLSVYLSYLRKTFGDHVRGKQNISLRPESAFWVDAEELKKVCQRIGSLDLDDPQLTNLCKRAIKLYKRGPFMAGIEGSWCIEEQNSLRSYVLEVYERLTRASQTQKHYSEAISSAHEWLSTSPYSEEAYRELMLAHWAMGDLSGAIKCFTEYEGIWRAELNSEPSNSMKTLRDELNSLSKDLEHVSEPDYKKRYEIDILLVRAQQYQHEGRRREQSVALEKAYQLARDLNDLTKIAAVQSKRSVFLWRTGKFSEAKNAAQEALQIYTKLNNHAGIVECHNYISYCEYYQGNYNEALLASQKGLKEAQKSGDKLLISKTLNSIGMAYMGLGKAHRAVESFEQSLELEIGQNPLEVGNILGNLGAAYHTLGQVDKALDCYQKSLEAQSETGHKWGLGSNNTNIGELYLSVGQYERAIDHLVKAQEVFSELNELHGQISILENIGKANLNLGNHRIAGESFDRALALARTIRDRDGEARMVLNLGVSLFQVGKYDEAMKKYLDAHELCKSIENPVLESVVSSRLAELELNSGNVAEAVYYSNRAIHLLKDSVATDQEMHWWIQYLVCNAQENESEAGRALKQAYELIMNKANEIKDQEMKDSFVIGVDLNSKVITEFESRM